MMTVRKNPKTLDNGQDKMSEQFFAQKSKFSLGRGEGVLALLSHRVGTDRACQEVALVARLRIFPAV